MEATEIKKEYKSKQYSKHRDKIRARFKEKYYANHEEYLKKIKKYRDANREKINERKRKYNREKPELKSEQNKLYRESKRGIEIRKKYSENNRAILRESRRVYDLERRKKDPQYKLLTNIRTNINRAINSKFKGGKAVALIGCSIEFLKDYLEKQFKPGMSWDNYGDWHIDHRLPCASFDLSKPDQQKQCFNFKNLQPLWAKDNLKKHAKIFGEERGLMIV